MLKIFKNFTPQTIIIILIWTIIVKLGYILYPIETELFTKSNTIDLITKWIFEYFNNQSEILTLIGIIFVVIQSLIINRLCTEYKLFQQDSFVPAALFLLITSLNPWFNIISAPMISATILLFIINNILRIQSTSMPKKLMYNCGIFIGISTIIYWPSIIILLFVIWTYAISKKVNIKELAAILLGIITVIYIVFAIVFLSEQPIGHPLNLISSISLPSKEIIKKEWLSITCTSILLTIGIYALNLHFGKIIESTKKMWWSIVIFLIMGCIIPFIQWHHTAAAWHFLLIPATMITANIWLTDINKWVRIGLFWLTALSIIINQYNLL